MMRFLLRRLMDLPLTVLLLVSLIWVVLELQPGEFAQAYLGGALSPQYREFLAEKMGLDAPAWERYLIFIKNAFTGELGVSLINFPKPVWDTILELLPRTMSLFFASFFIQLFVGYFLGQRLGWRQGRALDRIGTVLCALMWCVFLPLLSSLIIWVFNGVLKILPYAQFIDVSVARKYPDVDRNLTLLVIMGVAATMMIVLLLVQRRLRRLNRPGVKAGAMALLLLGCGGAFSLWLTFTPMGRVALSILHHMVAPVLTLTLLGAGFYALLMRDSMVQATKEDYVQLAKAKGLKDRVVRRRHAARNAILPLATSFLLAMAFTFDSAVLVESTFSWPGLGNALFRSLSGRGDMPVAVGIMIFLMAIASVAHLCLDVLYAYLDPRIRDRYAGVK
ncbi:MAG TPA: ABC transporter permease [Candidatus Bipolaricaulota bacterium]